jgi:transcriptional regulator with XRE-family HTH domain
MSPRRDSAERLDFSSNPTSCTSSPGGEVLADTSGMSAREAFGPNLRRLRIQRGVSLEQIAEATKVSKSLWAGLERNDLSRWPNGIYARSYIRDYAKAVGVDPEATVDEFCRCFPQGDRRAAQTIREQAEIVGHDLDWRDDPAPTGLEGDRRGSGATKPPVARPGGALAAFGQMFGRLRRARDRA